MKRGFKTAALVLLALAAAAFAWVQTATVVRQVKKPDELERNGVVLRTRTADALDYSVAIDIAAPAPIVWALLTDGPAYAQWSSTETLDGKIAKTEELRVAAKSHPDKTYVMRVSDLQKGERMVWEAGGKAVHVARTFTLLPSADGTRTTFAMSETFSGRLVPYVEIPDLSPDFSAFAKDLKTAAEKVAPPL